LVNLHRAAYTRCDFRRERAVFPSLSHSLVSLSNQIESNQAQTYTAPYIASESEALRLGLDRVGYVK